MLVVTVCTANLCRSPFAQHVLQREFAAAGIDVDVRSTGTQVVAGSVPPADWVDLARQFGVELGDHRAVAPGPWLDDADLVLTMTATHLRDVAVARPELVGRATTLVGAALQAAARAPLVAQQSAHAVLTTPPRDDIADPVARPKRVQRDVAASLVEVCTALARAWS